jgi:mRNA interferase RelE/StbE
MMIYRIEIEKSALKFIKSRNKKEQQIIFSKIYKLPDSGDIKKMTGYNNRFRLRIGDIRIIYDKYDDILKIIVIEIGNRGDIY